MLIPQNNSLRRINGQKMIDAQEPLLLASTDALEWHMKNIVFFQTDFNF